MQADILGFLDRLETGKAMSSGGVTLWPVYNHNRPGPPYLRLEDAIAANLASVEEKGPSGTVPLLLLVNKADTWVLALQGAELVGGRQNRTLNLSLLVRPRSVTDLPVSCVERGRWHAVSRGFTPGEKVPPKLRRDLHEQSMSSLRATGQAFSDQGAVWRSIEEELVAAQAASPTRAIRDAFVSREGDLGAAEAGLPYAAGAAGLVGGVEGGIALAEVFDRPATCEREWPRLVRSLAMQSRPSGTTAAGEPELEDFVRAARNVRVEVLRAPGAGRTVHLDAPALTGFALTYRNSVIHASLFANTRSR